MRSEVIFHAMSALVSALYSVGSLGKSGASGVASGLGGMARAAGSAAASPLKRSAAKATDSVKSSFAQGTKTGFGATGGSSTMGTVGGASVGAAASPSGNPPAWAQRMQHRQALSHGTTMAAHALRSGDGHGGGSSVNLQTSDRS